MAIKNVEPLAVGETKDYKFDFKAATNSSGNEDLLVTGETLASLTSVVSDTTALTVEASSPAAPALSDTNTSVTFWATGVTAGTAAKVTATVVTSASRTYVKCMIINVVDC